MINYQKMNVLSRKLETLHKLVILADTRAKDRGDEGMGAVYTDILRDMFGWKYETSEGIYEELRNGK